MGLSNFPSPAEGVLPVLVMNTLLSVALLKNAVRSVLQMMGAVRSPPPPSMISAGEEGDASDVDGGRETAAMERRIRITQFKHLLCAASWDDNNNNNNNCNSSSDNSSSSIGWECCVCLCGFEDEEEVSELSCKHFFHKGCLEKWFLNRHYSTCPLCRSIL